MITPSGLTISQYNDILALDKPTHARVTFTLENVVFEDEELEYGGGIKVTSYMNPDDEMKFGTAFCKEVVLHFVRSEKTDNLNWMGEFKLEFGVDSGNTVNWITIGFFTGKRPMWDRRNTIELLAYDRMTRFDISADDFLQNLTYPCTMQDIYDDLCVFVGATNTTGDEISTVMEYEYSEAPQFKTGMTCRQLLSVIAVANCCYARITNGGNVQLFWYHNHENDYRLDWDGCFDLDITDLQLHNRYKWRDLEDKQYSDVENVTYGYFDAENNESLDIRSLCFDWTEGEEEIFVSVPPEIETLTDVWNAMQQYVWGFVKQYTWEFVKNTSGSGNTYTVINNPLIYHDTEEEIAEHLQLMLNRLYGFSISFVAKISAVGNWLVETGDIIQFEVKRRELFAKYPIFNQIINWNGACGNEYETTGNISRETVYIE